MFVVPKRNIETWFAYLRGERPNEKDVYPKYGSEKKGAPTNYYLTVARERIQVNCELNHVDVVLCCDPKASTVVARQRAATKPRSSELFAKPCAPPSRFGLPPTATGKAS